MTWFEPYRVGDVEYIVADDEPRPLAVEVVLYLYRNTASKIVHPQTGRPATRYVVPVCLTRYWQRYHNSLHQQ